MTKFFVLTLALLVVCTLLHGSEASNAGRYGQGQGQAGGHGGFDEGFNNHGFGAQGGQGHGAGQGSGGHQTLGGQSGRSPYGLDGSKTGAGGSQSGYRFSDSRLRGGH